ncbi:MAG: hypothetical protein WCY36_07735 [Candidatus Omnitrophota bacterium]
MTKKLLCIATFFVIFSASYIYAGEGDVSKWREWITSQQDYLDRVESLMNMSKKLANVQNSQLQEAIKKSDNELGEKILVDTTKKLSSIVDLLKALESPVEFKEYHENVVKAYMYRLKANEATLKKDVLSIRNNTHAAMASEIAALESIRSLYVAHNAPPQIIDSIDRNIEAYNKRIVAN